MYFCTEVLLHLAYYLDNYPPGYRNLPVINFSMLKYVRRFPLLRNRLKCLVSLLTPVDRIFYRDCTISYHIMKKMIMCYLLRRSITVMN